MLDKRKFYINGAWVNPIDGRDLDVIDPSTEEAVAVISAGGTADTDAAVAAAKAALPASPVYVVAEVIPAVNTGYPSKRSSPASTSSASPASRASSR